MSTIIDVVAPRLIGPAVMVALAIIVQGYADVGDAFSAGVIVALAVTLRYLTLGPEAAERSLPVLRHTTAFVVAGLLIALAIGWFPVAYGEPPFSHLPRPGEHVIHVGTLELITAVGFDVGLFLLVSGILVLLAHQLAGLVEERRR